MAEAVTMASLASIATYAAFSAVCEQVSSAYRSHTIGQATMVLSMAGPMPVAGSMPGAGPMPEAGPKLSVSATSSTVKVATVEATKPEVQVDGSSSTVS